MLKELLKLIMNERGNVLTGDGEESSSEESTGGIVDNTEDASSSDDSQDDENNSEEAEGEEKEKSDDSTKGEDKTNSDKTDDGVVEIEGKTYVLQDRIQERIDELTAKAKAAEEKPDLLEAIRGNPALRKELAEELGRDQSAEDTKDAQEALTQKFLKGITDQKISGFYTNLVDAMSGDFEDYINRQFESKLSAIYAFMGEQRLKTFYGDVPDAKSYDKQIKAYLTKYPEVSPEDAYRSVAFIDKVKSAANKSAQDESVRKQKLKSTPIKKGSGGKPSKKKFGSLKDAMMEAAEETGF